MSQHDYCTKLWVFLVLPPAVLSHPCAHGYKTAWHWGKQGEKNDKLEVLLTFLPTFELFILWPKPSSTVEVLSLSDFLPICLRGICFVFAETARTGIHWFEPEVVTTHLQREPPHITGSLEKYLYFPTILRNKEHNVTLEPELCTHTMCFVSAFIVMCGEFIIWISSLLRVMKTLCGV